MSIIEQIKAEIERQEKQCPLDTYEGRHKLFILGGLKTFLSTLESENPMQEGLEEELDRWRHSHFNGERDGHFYGEYLERTSQLDLASHFAQWGAEHIADTRKTSPKDLEEAANEFANQDCVTFISRKKGFIAGAKWNMDKMMKEAVEGRVFMSFAPGHNQMVMADVDLPTNTNVRVIVLPKENEK